MTIEYRPRLHEPTTDDVAAGGVREIIDRGLVRSVYQPIVDLDSGKLVGYEALARGPGGTELEAPDRLFELADAEGLTMELDWECMASAIEGAMEAGLDRSLKLFVNVEPVQLGSPRPERLNALIGAASSTLSIVVEVTERALSHDPASLIHAMTNVRSTGLGVAIDDVGADPSSLALMPFVAPDVIKLDMRLVQNCPDSAFAAIANAVRSDAERRGSIILAEGIETAEHVDRAEVLGARLGQGWFYGRPGPLPARPIAPAAPDAVPFSIHSVDIAPTPWSLVETSTERRTASKELLIPMSRHVERRGMTSDPSTIISAFQDIDHFTSASRRRYEELARHQVLVGAIGTRMGCEPGSGVRGGTVDRDHPVANEWTVTVVGPHEASALIARELLPATTIDLERRFEYVITHDRDTVVAAARSLMQFIDHV